MFDEKTDGGEGVYQGSYHWRDSYIYARSATYHRGERTMGPVRPGKNLYFFDPAKPQAAPRQLTFLKTGAVFKPEPSFDGKKVLFSMRRDGEDWFDLYEVNVDGTNLRQLTDGPFNDFAGVYLPDGRIVFVSDRTGYLEEYHEERTECLFVMNGDGTGIHQITFMPGTYFEPTVLQDGRIMFSFWDAFHIDVPPLDKHETFLMTVNPDGTEERHLFGAGQYQFFNRERHSGIGLTQAHEMPDGRILCQSELGPSLIDLGYGTNVRDALWPIFPGTTSIQLGGTTHRAHLSPLGTRSTARPLADGRLLYSATAPGARDAGIYVCHPDTREEELVVNIPNYAEFDAVPVLVERTRPRRLPNKIQKPAEYAGGDPLATTRFLVVAGRETDNPQRAEALKKARYFRVIEAEYTGVTTSSHTNLETRILGIVPIFPDGSAYFEAPADTPLFLDALDAAGNRVLHEWPFANTSVPQGSLYPMTQMAHMVGRAGETKSCYGCHAPQTNAVPNTTLEAIKHPAVKITRESTDLQYRRNDPEAYRRQARLGEETKAREWLKSKDPVLRARGCEMLMYADVLAGEDAAAVAKLLADESAEVRRMAALALTRLGAVKEITALERALKDDDWQVCFSARCALEAIGRWSPPEGLTTAKSEWYGRRYKFSYHANTLKELEQPLPDVAAIRAAGRLKWDDAGPVRLLSPWLKKHEQEYHAAEAAVALGRIGTPQAIDALWAALRSEVPNKQVVYARYLQHGPRPEEYAILKGLVLADAKPQTADVHLLIAMLPNTFMEKPRFEDRLREESQRVLMPRMLLEKAGFRKKIIEILLGKTKDSVLTEQVIKGINLERPFSEHGRPFPVIKEIGPEESLWLLTCLAERGEVPEEFVIPHLTSKNHRERIDAAVLLGQQGFTAKGAAALAAEISKPYSFPEISSIGKGMPDENFRDKAYMVMALAMHIDDVNQLRPFANPKTMYRDIRYGLTRGLARRGKPDAIPLLVEMASRDPLTLIRQQARYAVADMQDICRLNGVGCPPVQWPPPQPLEALYYPPRGLKWSDTTPDPLPRIELTKDTDFKRLLAPANFRNLNLAQAQGAQRMMIRDVAETDVAFRSLRTNGTERAMKELLSALDSPYPYANHLAAANLAEAQSAAATPALITKLDAYAKAPNPVGFWWSCEALAKLKAKEAIPKLTQYATATNLPGTFGPDGMPTGYIAAKALAQIAADPNQPEVARLLKQDNIWLKAGVLRGLAEARAPGAAELFKKAASPDQPAVVRQESRMQLERLAMNKAVERGR
jgi:HEAT repeat protein